MKLTLPQSHALRTFIGDGPSPSQEGRPLLSTCSACGSVAFRWRFRKKDSQFWRCQNCGMERQFPLPQSIRLKLYSRSSDLRHSSEFSETSEIRRLTAEYRFRTIRHDCNPKRWLDVGSGTGEFLNVLRDHRIEATGIDTIKASINSARARGLHAICTSIDDFQPSTKYSTITAFNVLETVADPVHFIRIVHRLLVRDGTLILTTPNLQSLSRALMGRHWYYYRPEQNSFHFSRSNLPLLLERNGFETRCCRPIAKPLLFAYSLRKMRNRYPWIDRAAVFFGVSPKHCENCLYHSTRVR